MSSTAQTGYTHVGEPSKAQPSPPPSAPPPPPPTLHSSRAGYPASEDETGDNPLRRLENEKEVAKNIFLAPRTASKPPPIPPSNFQTEQQTHAFPPRPEPAQTNGPARKRRHYPRPSRQDLGRLSQNHEFATPDIEIDFIPPSYANCSPDSEPRRERLQSKKRGATRCAPEAFSNPADFQAKPQDDEDDEDDGFLELVDLSDVEFDVGERFERAFQFANSGMERTSFGDRRMMSPPERGNLYGAFTGGFDADYFNDNNWGHVDGVLGTEPMPSLFNFNGIDSDEGDGPGMRNVPGMVEAGNAQSREAEFETAWFGDRERHVRSERIIPGGLIELARRRTGGDEEEGPSVGATKYMIDEVHHQNMVRALKEKPSMTPNVEAESASVKDTGTVERNQTESAKAWKQQRSKRRRVSRIPVAVKSKKTGD